MTWTLFEVTPERAKEIRRKRGLLLAHEIQRDPPTERPPLPYVETPEDVKRARAEALERRLQSVDFYGKPVT